jgi:hypothetical protein
MAVKRIAGRDTEITHYDSAETGITAFDVDAASQSATSNFIDCANAKAIVAVIVKTGTGLSGATASATIQFFDDAGVAMSEALNLYTAATIPATDPFRLVFGLGQMGVFTSLGTVGASLTAAAAGGALAFPKCKISIATGLIGSGTAVAALHVFVKR